MASSTEISEKINHWPGFLTLIGGIIAIIAAVLWVSHDSIWASLLINAGTALGLVWPIHGITQAMRIRVEKRVEEQQQELGEWKNAQDREISEISKRVMSLEEREQVVSDAQKARRSQERADLVALKDGEPVGGTLIRALDTARNRNLIDDKHGILVPLAESSDFTVGFTLTLFVVQVQLYDEQGRPVLSSPLPIKESDDLNMLVADLGAHALSRGENVQASIISIFGGLADALLTAEKHNNLGPIIQHFPSPQKTGNRSAEWVLTRDKITAERGGASIFHNDNNYSTRVQHYYRKPWIEHGSYEAALAAAAKFKESHLTIGTN